MRYFIIALLWTLSSAVYAADDGVDVLLHGDNPESTLEYGDVYDIFLFNKDHWNNGQQIVVVTYPLTSSEHKLFLQTYVGISYISYSRRYNNRLNSGRGSPPMVVKDLSDMMGTVGGSEGSVGYTIESVKDLMSQYNIKVISIE